MNGTLAKMTVVVSAILLEALICQQVAGAANVVDQQNTPPGYTAAFSLRESFVWQQEVRAGVAGQLLGFDIQLGRIPAQVIVFLNRGRGWQDDVNDFETVVTQNKSTEWTFIDTSAANITFSPGEYFVIGLELVPGTERTSFLGNFEQTEPGSYERGALYNKYFTSPPALVAGGDMWFRTYMATQGPVVDAGPDQVVQCSSAVGAIVELDGTNSYDPDGASLTWHWEADGVIFDDPDISSPIGLFPIGTTSAVLTVTDELGRINVDDVTITVVDITPPDVICTTDPVVLFPVDRELVPVLVEVTATDTCSDPEGLSIISATIVSDEPDAGLFGGDLPGDVNCEDGFTQPVDVTDLFVPGEEPGTFFALVLLRAERDVTGDGRTYAVRVDVADESWNVSTATTVIVVPRDRRPEVIVQPF